MTNNTSRWRRFSPPQSAGPCWRLWRVAEIIRIAVAAALIGLVVGRPGRISAADVEGAPQEAWRRSVGKAMNGVSMQIPGGMAIDDAGDCVIVGTSGGVHSMEMFVVKKSGANGGLLWSLPKSDRVFPPGRLLQVRGIGTGDLVVVGTAYEPRDVPHDWFVARLDGNTGSTVWQQAPEKLDDAWNEPMCMVVTDDGDVVVAGSAEKAVPSGSQRKPELLVKKYSGANGSILWVYRSSEARIFSQQYGEMLAVRRDGDVIVGIGASSDADGGGDGWLGRLDGRTGNPKWQRRLGLGDAGSVSSANGQPSLASFVSTRSPCFVAVDESGDVVMAKQSLREDGRWNQTTWRIRGTDGTVIWAREYDGASKDAWPRGLGVDPATGDVVVTSGIWGGSFLQYHTVRYSSEDGEKLWEKLYDQRFPVLEFRGHRPMALAIDGNGDVLVTGSSHWTNGSMSVLTVKYRGQDGEPLWERRTPGGWGSDRSDDAIPAAVGITPGGDVVWTAGGCLQEAERCGDLYTARLSGNTGEVRWLTSFDTPVNLDDYAASVAVGPDGNVVVGGSLSGLEYDNVLLNTEFMTGLAGEDGTQHWQETNVFNGSFRQHLFVRMGVSGQSVSVEHLTLTNRLVKRFAASGDTLWVTKFGRSGWSYEEPAGLALDGSEDVFFLGASFESFTNRDVITRKFAGVTGLGVWARVYVGPEAKEDHGTSVVAAGNGDAVVVGYSLDTNRVSEAFAARYASSDGAVVWERQYPGGQEAPGHGRYGRCVGVDGEGDVLMAGERWNGTDDDCWVMKLDGGTGDPMWEAQLPGYGGGADRVKAMVMEPNGDVVVGADGWNGRNWDMRMTRLSGSTGAVRWDQWYVGPEDLEDTMAALQLDGQGRLLVLGTTSKLVTGADMVLMERARDTGERVWERRLDAAGLDDQAVGMGVDGMGGIVVCGNSRLGGMLGFDVLVARYVEGGSGVRVSARRSGEAGAEVVEVRVEGMQGTGWRMMRSWDLRKWEDVGSLDGGDGGVGVWVDREGGRRARFYRAERG